MRGLSLGLILVGVAGIAGCSTAATRIRENPEFYQSLDPAAQQKIARGEIEVGYSPDMVRLALGTPTREFSGEHRDEVVWLYRNLHRDRNDIIRGGYRRRVVFDPVLRSETVVIERIDDRLAAKLAPQSLRLTFQNGRLVSLERVPEM